MRRVIYFTIFGFFVLMLASVSQATPIVMKGDYIYTQISDDGTLGNGSSYPGIQYDPTGKSNFPGTGGKDFLQPGSPWEAFSIKSNETGIVNNNNDGWSTDQMGGTLIDLSSSSSYDFYVRWSGSYKDYYYKDYFDIIIDTYFNEDDKYIMFTTTITSKEDLTDLKFLRTIDPDQDVNDYYGHFETINVRGYGSIAAEDWVYASGPYSDWTIGLYSDSSFTHNTGISSVWSLDPDVYLNGINDGDGDYTIGIAFDLGNLSKGNSVTFKYAYVLGVNPDDAVNNIPTATVPIPEPTTMFLFGSGLIGLAGVRWRKR